jgi:hypothetical protein
MNKNWFLFVTIGTLACLIFTWIPRGPALSQEKPAAAVQKWEYKVVQKAVSELNEKDVVAEFNGLGAEGWELSSTVSLTIRTMPYGALIFKRPKR